MKCLWENVKSIEFFFQSRSKVWVFNEGVFLVKGLVLFCLFH
jgi:hypothetical protein